MKSSQLRDKIDESKVMQDLSTRGIKWKFITRSRNGEEVGGKE